MSVIACGYEGCEEREQAGELTIHRVGGRSTVFPRAIWRQWRGLVPDADVVLEVVNGITFLTPLWLRTPHVPLVHHIHRDHYVREMGRKGALAAWATRDGAAQAALRPLALPHDLERGRRRHIGARDPARADR